MKQNLHPLLRFVSSYALGIVMLALMMLLTVLGTLYQAEHGLFRAQQLFYASYGFLYPLGDSGLKLPLPGARLLMVILFINLLAATIWRMKPSRRVVGVYIIHAGILLLLAGGFLTAYGSYEAYMELREGGTSNFSTRFHEEELVIAHTSAPGEETVTAIRHLDHVKDGTVLLRRSPEVPFDLVVEELVHDGVAEVDSEGAFAKARGLTYPGSQQLQLMRAPPGPNDQKLLAGIFRARRDGQPDELFLLSDILDDDVRLMVGGQEYRLRLRNRRDYYPFTLHLHDFQRETHPGTMMNRSYASNVTLIDETAGEKRDVRIYMNNPLRYQTYTFYQASFGDNDRLSVLQVVKNAGLVFPYIATVIISIGLLWQFATVLVSRANQQRRLSEPPPNA